MTANRKQRIQSGGHYLRIMADKKMGSGQKSLFKRLKAYQGLSESEKILFRRLSVFNGGFTLDAAAAVCNPDRDLDIELQQALTSLKKKLLLRHEIVDGDSRFIMSEATREFGVKRLVESREGDKIKRNHASYFLALAEDENSKLDNDFVGDRSSWLAQMDIEFDNLRSAMKWSQSEIGEIKIGLRIVGSLIRFWFGRGLYREGLKWYESLMTKSDKLGQTKLWAKALYGRANLVLAEGDPNDAHPLLEECATIAKELNDKRFLAYVSTIQGLAFLGELEKLDLSRTFFEKSVSLFREDDDKWGVAWALYHLGLWYEGQEKYSRARAIYEESLDIFNEVGDHAASARPYLGLGSLEYKKGNYDTARAFIEKSLAFRRMTQDKPPIASILALLGEVARCQSDYRRAAEVFNESSILFTALNKKERAGRMIHNMAHAVLYRGEDKRAKELFTDSLKYYQEINDTLGVIMCIAGLARVASTQGNYKQSAQLFGAVETLLRETTEILSTTDRADYDRSLVDVQEHMDQETFVEAYTEGQEMSLEQATRCALEGNWPSS